MTDRKYGFDACWKDLGKLPRGGTIHCRMPKGHAGDCVGAMQWKVSSRFGPSYNLNWSEESTAVWEKIWMAVQDGTILTLSREEVERLGGMLWNIGVFK